MDLVTHFRMLAGYNRVANERLFEKCAELDDTEYRKQRQGSFGSIAGLLNHILLGDRIWMARFEGGGATTPPLDTVLFDKFLALRSARAEEDARIESFFGNLDAGFFERSLKYVNSKGVSRVDAPAMAIGHFFNHQTHHRGQVHVMLSQTPVSPPSLDLHWIVSP
jgi:uncharacterized damage-inducible protein DinB